MSLFVALILGIIQGLTEFIPVSSTAHLTVAATLLGVVDPLHPERWTAFMATIQLGTLAAVIGYFRTDIWRSASSWLRENLGKSARPFKEQSPDARLGWLVIVGTIPIVVVGLSLKSVLEGSLTKELWLIGGSLMGVALLLWLAEKKATFHRTTSDLTITDAVVVGAAQCLALIPGSSRSGSTMMAALFRGMTREHAARFSFLLSIPAILAAGVLEFISELKHLGEAGGLLPLAVATVASLVSGYWSIAFLLRYLRTHSLRVFILYRLVVGAALLLSGCSGGKTEDVQELRELKAPVPTSDTVRETAPATAVVATDTVVVTTSMGSFAIELYGTESPKTVENFLGLVKEKFYDGLLFHRVASGFVIQAGDPLTANPAQRAAWGTGGRTANGKPLPEELNPAGPFAQTKYTKGSVAMARKQAPGSGTSQFFVCLEKASVLPYQYTIFGHVIEGIHVVEAIGRVEVEPGPHGDADGIPRNPVVIRSIKRTSLPH